MKSGEVDTSNENDGGKRENGEGLECNIGSWIGPPVWTSLEGRMPEHQQLEPAQT